jgi:hypothetical protein
MHTKGPWEWNGTAGIYSGKKRVANVYVKGEVELPHKEMDDNARLIASAPALLSACKCAVDYLGGWPTYQAQLKCREFILETIRKAEGR